MEEKKEEQTERKEETPTIPEDLFNFGNLYDDDLVSLFSNSPLESPERLSFDEERNYETNGIMSKELRKVIEENFKKLDETGQIEALNLIDMMDSSAVNFEEDDVNVKFDQLQEETLWSLKEFIEDYNNEFQKDKNTIQTCQEKEVHIYPTIQNLQKQSKQQEKSFENFPKKNDEKFGAGLIHEFINPMYINHVYPFANQFNNNFNFLNSNFPPQQNSNFKWNLPVLPHDKMFKNEKNKTFQEEDFTEKFFNQKFLSELNNPKKRNLNNIEFEKVKKPKIEIPSLYSKTPQKPVQIPILPQTQNISPNTVKQETQITNESSKKFTITIEIMTLEKDENDDLYHCEICEKSYKDRSNLVKHLRIHTKEKPFECKICGKEFAHSQSKNDHMNIHKQKKPYQCKLCDKTFGNGSNLRRHMTGVHQQQKKHKCEYCDQKFSQKTNLNSHIKKSHFMMSKK
eukprot:gene9590-1792_t